MARIVIRFFSDFDPTEDQLIFIRECFELISPSTEYTVHWNRGGECDVAVVVNYAKRFSWVRVPKGRIFKFVHEPVIRNNLSRRSSHSHSRIFSRILTHSADESDERQIESVPGILPSSGIGIDTWKSASRKTKRISVVSSRLRDTEGHRLRDDVISQVCASKNISIDCFGRGRNEIASKLEGLKEYRYSVAIENSASDSYVSEKFTDCLLAQTIPIYFGAPKLSSYFPEESYFKLPALNVAEIEKAVLSCSDEDYQSRLAALNTARELAVFEYSLPAQVLKLLKNDEPRARVLRDRYSRVWTFDTCLRLISSVLYKALSGARGLRLSGKLGH